MIDMKYLIPGVILLILSSCSTDKRLDDYNQIVDSADKILFYTKVTDTFALTKNVVSAEQLHNLKSILKRDVERQYQRKFIPKHKIEIYKRGNLVGVLFISATKEDPFVNFKNDTFGFGFKLTYGIGMSL